MTRETEQNQRKAVITATYEDPILFLRTFFPHWFTKKISWAHRGLLAILLRRTDFLLNFGKETWPEGEAYWTKRELAKIIKFFVWREQPEDPGIPLFELEELGNEDYALHLNVAPNTQVVWPRGFGKTTLINAANIFKTVFKMRKFLVYVSETARHAEAQLENVKRELATNERLIGIFGTQKPERNDEESWRHDFFETTGGVAFAARGRGGQVRGLLHGASRPDDITVDDVEDKESVSTPDQRDKTLSWFYADVVPALNQITKEGVINMIGTLLHREALIPKVMGDPDWVSIVFGAEDPDGEPLWIEYMTKGDIAKKKKSFARVGKLDEFYMEFLSQLRNSESSRFKSPFIIRPMSRSDFVGVALVQDPAISSDPNADFCAFGVTGITPHGNHHVLEVYGERGMHPRAQIDKYFELKFKWDPTQCGIEAVAYQKALIHLVKEEMFRKAKTFGPRAYFEIIPILHGKQGKIPRVEGILAPRYAAGYISHQRVFPELETQLIEWPKDKMDFPDVVAMCISLLDPYAASAYQDGAPEGSPEFEDKLAKDMYEPLEEDYYRGAP